MKTFVYKLILPLFLWFILTPNALFADDSRYKEVLVGDRASGMGGAYAAVSDDTSGAYYNPAGMVFGAQTSMTGISNVYHYNDGVYDTYQTEKDERWENLEERGGGQYFVSSLGYMRRIDNIVLGASFAIDDSMEMNQHQEFSNIFKADDSIVVSRRGQERTYKYGPSFAVLVSDDFSFGGTLYYYNKESSSQSNIVYRWNEGAQEKSEWKYENHVGSELGWDIKTGLMWTPMEPVSVGLVVSKTYLHWAGILEQTTEKTANSENITNTYEMTHIKREFPLKVALGIAVFPSPYLLVSAEFDYYHLTSKGKRSLMNSSIGAEYFIDEQNAIRAGWFTNLDNDEPPNDLSPVGTERVDMFGISAGYSIFTGASMITLSGVYGSGSGTAKVLENSTVMQQTARNFYSLVLSVAYNID